MAFQQDDGQKLQALIAEAEKIRAEEQARIEAAKAGLERRMWQFIRLIRNSVALTSPAPKALDARAAKLGIHVGRDGRLRMDVETPYVGVDGRVSLAQESNKAFWETVWDAAKGVLARDIPAQDQAALIDRLVETALRYGVDTRFELLEVPGYGLYVLAKVRVPGLGYAEGWAQIPKPAPNGRSAEDTNPVEVAQTSAVGRALGFLGLGLLGNGIASAEEVEQALEARGETPPAAETEPATSAQVPRTQPEPQPPAASGPAAQARSTATPPATANMAASASTASSAGSPSLTAGQAVEVEGVVSGNPRQQKYKGTPYMSCPITLQEGREIYLVGFSQPAWQLVEELIRGQVIRVRGLPKSSTAIEPEAIEVVQAAAS